MAISNEQLVALSKQVFIRDYLLNGLFPCQSDIVRSIRSKKKEWAFNDKFEYRMLLANTNTGGSLNSQVFKESVGLIKPGQLEYGTYHATYGTVSDGFDVDMMLNLETDNKKAAFVSDYSTRMNSLRNNVAALFKNFAIHGRFGVVHQIRASITAPNLSSDLNPQPNVMTAGTDISVGDVFTIKVPINVFASNFKAGKLLIKTKAAAPWGAADVTELYLVLDNQPNRLTLLACGTTVSDWQDGEFLEVAQNREIAANSNAWTSWSSGALTVSSGPWAGTYDQFTGTGSYTSGASAVTGAMEGIADLLPWYTDPSAPSTRLGLDLPFRDQANRLQYSTEQAGGWIVQEYDSSTGEYEHIIDAIMRGVFLTKSTVPYAEIGVWMNPVTRLALGYEEGTNVQVLRDNMTEGPIIYQRGIKSTDYQIGNQVVREVVEDMNMPTDVIIIGPKDQMLYNCFDNSMMEIDNYIQETWGKQLPPDIKDLSIPKELVAKMDLSQRMTFGSPTLTDGTTATFQYGNGFRHPKNVVPVAMHEMGALYTEYPYAYTVIKLREPICDLKTM